MAHVNAGHPKRDFVRIDSHSVYGTHTNTIPLKGITSAGLGDAGTLSLWDGTDTAADVYIKGFIDLLKANMQTTYVYDRFTLFRVPTPTDDPQPVWEEAYNAVGTATLTGVDKATSLTVSIRTTGFNLFKFVFLDRANANTWGNRYSTDTGTQAVITALTAADSAFAGRNGDRPLVYSNASFSLNKRLRRRYGMI